jgi:hypothetical protein
MDSHILKWGWFLFGVEAKGPSHCGEQFSTCELGCMGTQLQLRPDDLALGANSRSGAPANNIFTEYGNAGVFKLEREVINNSSFVELHK